MENKKIIDYKTVKGYHISNFNLDDFHNEVLKLVQKGYIPLGGSSIYRETIVQAMVKYEE
jgi:hypothetical protein